MIARLLAAAVALAALAAPARAADPDESCSAPASIANLGVGLTRTAAAVQDGRPVVAVAIGSSSTAGVGASSPARTYPARLEEELSQRLLGAEVRIVNKGVSGETVDDMLARFERDVLAEKPDLVVWQVGSNSVLRGDRFGPFAETLRAGIRRLQGAGVDVILMDPQYAPRVTAKADHGEMIDLIDEIAREHDVAVFHRYSIMRYWTLDRGVALERTIGADGLHLNDYSYACIARLLAAGIAARVQPLAATARRPR